MIREKNQSIYFLASATESNGSTESFRKLNVDMDATWKSGGRTGGQKRIIQLSNDYLVLFLLQFKPEHYFHQIQSKFEIDSFQIGN